MRQNPSAVGVHNENSDDIRSIWTYSLTRGLRYAMHARRYILLANICNEYAFQSLQHIWNMTFYWIFLLFGNGESTEPGKKVLFFFLFFFVLFFLFFFSLFSQTEISAKFLELLKWYFGLKY